VLFFLWIHPRIVYFLAEHPCYAKRFEPVFQAHRDGRLRFAVTTIAIAAVLAGPLQLGEEALARRFGASSSLGRYSI